jgi:hypothetical protein
MQAHALADIEINYEVERIRAWRYRKVSDYMRRLDKDALFSATACRERYNAILEGTSRIPTEMDDDPDARRLELENYRESRELARNKEQAEKEAKEAKERKARDAAKSLNAQKAEEIAVKRQQKEEEKAQRAMKRAVAAQVRSQRAGENTIAKSQRNAQIQKQKEREASTSKAKGKTTATTKRASSPSNGLNLTNAEITTDTHEPRSYLSVADLVKMCSSRGLRGLGKNKDELVDELRDADSEWSLQDLEKMCRSKGLDYSGSKLQMKYHLALAAAKTCKSFRAGVEAMAGANEDTAMDEEE